MIKSKDGMDENTGRILPCCEHAYLIEVVKSKLIDDGFSSIPSVSSKYDLLGEKFMDLRLSPKRYAQYLYIIIKVGDEPLTEFEQGWFDYVHSLESIKQVEALIKYEDKFKKKLKYFVQINIGGESQKSGINIEDTKNFLDTCRNKYDLNIIGLMCLPPDDKFPERYFKEIKDLKMSLLKLHQHQVLELSMGMSDDYIKAIGYGSTYIRIGTKIFGKRK